MTRLAALLVLAAWFAVAAPAGWATGGAADVVRQWVVARYAAAGSDPYALADAVLRAKFGSAAAAGKVFFIPRDVPPELEPRIDPALGPPEATYPPPAVALFAGLLGWLPSVEAVLAAWLVANALSAVAVVYLLARLYPLTPGRWNVLLVAVLFALFTPTYTAVANGQFSLPVLALLLVGLLPVRESVAGLALGLALVKPNFALPFAVAELAAGRWKRVLVAAAVQLAGWLGLAAWTGTDPLALVRGWLAVSQYFLQGQYSVQEVVNALGWRGTPKGTAVSLAALAAVGVLAFVLRRAGGRERFAAVGAAGLLWVYHGPYDFVCLLPPLLLLLGGSKWERLAGAAAFVLLTLALAPAVYVGEGQLARGLRWGGRAGIAGVLAASVVGAKNRKPGAVAPGSRGPGSAP